MNAKAENLVLENMGLVWFVAKKYEERPDYEDIIQTGLVGLCEAANRFDETKNYKFSTYAVTYIRGKILTYYRTYAISPLKLNREDADGFIKGKKNIQLENLDFEFLDGGCIHDVIPAADMERGMDFRLELWLLKKRLKNFVSNHEFEIYILYWEKELTQKKIAGLMHISQSYVSRILAKINQIIKQQLTVL